jgi:hypothetical protein
MALLHGAFRRRSDHDCMDLIAIVIAVGCFALLALLIEGLDRV